MSEENAKAREEFTEEDTKMNGSGKNRRDEKTLKENKILKIIVFILIILVIALIIALLVVAMRKKQVYSYFRIKDVVEHFLMVENRIIKSEISEIEDLDICNSNLCKQIAKNLHSSLNLSVDPCDDFYAFSCGGWVKTHPRPPNAHQWGQMVLMDKENKEKLADIKFSDLLEEEDNYDSSAVRMAKDYYAACSNLDFI
ncbi:neprilysin-11-like protein [Dinothrombium tinctorium]|uniref:Neprilysin-11-like protein n=1 Tax=Dinothrombium tinctorium TaxID=1965070 RepID=A0A443QQS9_9ACAR|nr:neprilysin-11-like protein [Dinothrombium tinctorium]